jgi:multidrug efflux pump subunit AcrA (membrane-fusion protein)
MPTRALAGALASAALLLGGCAAPGSGTAEAAPATGPGAELAVRRGAFERRVILTGALEAARAVPLSVPRTPSWQVELRWLAEDGVAVRAGEPVAELDKSAFATDLEEKEIALEGQLSELERRRVEVLVQTREKEF